MPERVDGGDAEDVADHATGGRAPALAPDPLVGGVPDDVVDDQEVAREPEPGDQVEFVVELPPGRSRPRVGAGAVAADAGGLRAVPQPRILRVPGGHGELRQFGAQFAEVDDTGAAQGDGGVRDARIPGQERRPLGPGTQVRGRGGHQMPGGPVQGLAAAQRGERLRHTGLAGAA